LVRVPPKPMAPQRRAGRARGKSDPTAGKPRARKPRKKKESAEDE
jgi:hypothetical protein